METIRRTEIDGDVVWNGGKLFEGRECIKGSHLGLQRFLE